MRAKINGIEVEGTPEEVAAYLKIMDDMQKDEKHIKPHLGKMPDCLTKDVHIKTVGTVVGAYAKPIKCWAALNGGCNCTGACMK